jgi:hypothetical protein
VAACASKPALTTSASRNLAAEVAAVRTAAAQQDPAAAKLALDQLRATLLQLEQQGQVSATRAGAILSAAATVQDQLATLPATTAPPTTTTTAAPPKVHGKDGGGKGGGGD